MLTLDEYEKLTPAQQKKVHKEELQNLIDTQSALLNNDPNEIRNVITNTINSALDKKFEQLAKEISTENKRISDENIVLRKAVIEQQKCLERLCNDKMKDNIFITGIPTELNVADEVINLYKE